jgi:hypothetical protein
LPSTCAIRLALTELLLGVFAFDLELLLLLGDFLLLFADDFERLLLLEGDFPLLLA